ncbi:hypothetical protein [Roseiconus lacunae]|uniref:hypothetical protein n=1 Tax=Roseiconus lacunae TaxID=2605694 RepID=UPI0011F18954|nr:hypothetical protein [Roseiconus lacunae]
MKTKHMTESERRAWMGRAKDFSTPTETALCFEGARKFDTLVAAEWPSLRAWVDVQLEDIRDGLREPPKVITNNSPKPKANREGLNWRPADSMSSTELAVERAVAAVRRLQDSLGGR